MAFVNVRTLSINKNRQGVTAFSDPLNGAAGPLGANWAEGNIGFTPVAPPVSWSHFSLDGTNGTTVFQGSANPTQILFNYAFPTPIAKSIFGLNQFIQFTYQGTTSASTATVLHAMLGFLPSAMPIFYAVVWNPGTPFLNIRKSAGNGNNAPGTALNQSTIAGSTINANALPVGTVVRFSVQWNPAGNILTVSINGVQNLQITDNVAPLNAGGIPGMGAQMHDGNFTFNNFSCGVGL